MAERKPPTAGRAGVTEIQQNAGAVESSGHTLVVVDCRVLSLRERDRIEMSSRCHDMAAS